MEIAAEGPLSEAVVESMITDSGPPNACCVMRNRRYLYIGRRAGEVIASKISLSDCHGNNPRAPWGPARMEVEVISIVASEHAGIQRYSSVRCTMDSHE
jgi:hypothetical protein